MSFGNFEKNIQCVHDFHKHNVAQGSCSEQYVGIWSIGMFFVNNGLKKWGSRCLMLFWWKTIPNNFVLEVDQFELYS